MQHPNGSPPAAHFSAPIGEGCLRRPISDAPEARCDLQRRHRRSTGHIFSAPGWRGVPPAAHSFLSCQKRMGRKEALGTRNSAYAPEKAFCFCMPFTDSASRKERPSGGPQNFCCLKFRCGKYLCLQNRKASVPNPCRGFQVLPVSAPQFLLAAEEKRAKQKDQRSEAQARQRYKIVPAVFSSISFLPRQKRYGPRSGGDGAANRTALPAHTNARSEALLIPIHPMSAGSYRENAP